MAKNLSEREYNAMSQPELIAYLEPFTATEFADVPPRVKVRFFVSKYGKDIAAAIKGTGLFFSAVVAQKILESNYGKSLLTIKANNFAGVKKVESFPSIKMDTVEIVKGKPRTVSQEFAKYPTPKDAFDSYVRNLKNNIRYAKVFVAETPEQQILEMAKAGYTTTPANDYLYRVQGNINRVRDMYAIGKVV